MRNLHRRFDWHYILRTNLRWRFRKILWPSKNVWTLIGHLRVKSVRPKLSSFCRRSLYWTCCPTNILIKLFDLKISCNLICITLLRTSQLYQFCISLYFFTGTCIVRRIYHLRNVTLLWKNLRHEKSRNWQTNWVSNNTPRSSKMW